MKSNRRLSLRLLLFLVSLSWGLAATTWALETNPSYSSGSFQKASVVRLFADAVNLREAPNTTSKVVAKLPMGAALTIQGEPEGEFQVNGLMADWYAVQTSVDGKAVSGYVWGGFLALGSVAWNEAGRDLKLLVGITSHEKSEFKAEARVVSGNTILAKASFPLTCTDMGDSKKYGYGIELAPFEAFTFPGMTRTFRLHMFYEACGYENGQRLLFWDGKKLLMGPLASSVSEAGIFRVTSEFVLPETPSGKDPTLIIKTTELMQEEKTACEKTRAYTLHNGAWSEGAEEKRNLPYPGGE